MDAPDTSAARPGLRLRITGLVVARPVRPARPPVVGAHRAPGAGGGPGGGANQIRAVPVEPTRGLILDRYGNPLVNNAGDRADHPVPGHRHPAARRWSVAWPPCSAQTTAQVKATIADPEYSLYRPVPGPDQRPLDRHPLHQGAPERVSRGDVGGHHPAQLPAAGDARPGPDGLPGAQALGYVGTINSTELKSRALPGLPGRRPLRPVRPRVPVRVRAAGHPRPTAAGGQSRGRGGGHPQDDAGHGRRQPGHQHRHRPPAGGRQRPGHPDPGTCARHIDPQCNNDTGCYPAATGGAVVVMEPADRRRLRHVLLSDLQPIGVGRGDLHRQLRGPVQSGQQRAADQPGHRRAVHAGLDLQAQHGHRRPRHRAVDPDRLLRRHRHLSPPRGASTTAPPAPCTTARATAASARSTCRPPSPCRATTSSTTWAPCSTTTGASLRARPRSRTRPPSTGWAS